MTGLLDLFGPGSAGAGRWLQGLLQAQPQQPPGISVPGNQYYPGYSFGAMNYPALQRLGVVPQGGLPPGAAMQQNYARGLLSAPQAAPQQQAAPMPGTSPQQAAQNSLLAMLAKQQIRTLDPMNAHYGAISQLAGGHYGSGNGG